MRADREPYPSRDSGVTVCPRRVLRGELLERVRASDAARAEPVSTAVALSALPGCDSRQRQRSRSELVGLERRVPRLRLCDPGSVSLGRARRGVDVCRGLSRRGGPRLGRLVGADRRLVRPFPVARALDGDLHSHNSSDFGLRSETGRVITAPTLPGPAAVASRGRRPWRGQSRDWDRAPTAHWND